MRWIFLLLLLFPLAAQAGWDSDEDGTGIVCEEQPPNPSQQRRCWWNFTNATGTGNSSLLKIDQCENWSVAFRPDFDGTGTTATIRVYVCLDDAANTNACYWLRNVELSYTVPVIYGADGTWLYVDIITGAGAGENARVEFRCNQ